MSVVAAAGIVLLSSDLEKIKPIISSDLEKIRPINPATLPELHEPETKSPQPSQPPIPQPPQPQRLYRQPELRRIVAALLASSSILVVGAEGSGKSYLGNAVLEELRGRGFTSVWLEPATAKQMLTEAAQQLGLETTDLSGKQLTVDGLKRSLTDYLTSNTAFLIFDDAHTIEAKFRMWLKELKRKGVPLLLLATNPPRTDVFLNCSALILKPLPEYSIRDLMEKTALEMGLDLKPYELAKLQTLAHGNPMLAVRVIHDEHLGIQSEASDSKNEFDLTPLILLIGVVFVVARYLALSLHSPGLYVLSGTLAAVFLGVSRLLRSLPRESNRIRG